MMKRRSSWWSLMMNSSFVVRRAVQQIGDHARGDVDRDERIERQHPAVGSSVARTQSETDDGQTLTARRNRRRAGCRSKLDAGKLLQQHRHDVRAACSRLLARDDAPARYRMTTAPMIHVSSRSFDGRAVPPAATPDRESRRRGVGIDQPRQHVHETRRIERSQHRARTGNCPPKTSIAVTSAASNI